MFKVYKNRFTLVSYVLITYNSIFSEFMSESAGLSFRNLDILLSNDCIRWMYTSNINLKSRLLFNLTTFLFLNSQQ